MNLQGVRLCLGVASLQGGALWKSKEGRTKKMQNRLPSREATQLCFTIVYSMCNAMMCEGRKKNEEVRRTRSRKSTNTD